MFKSRSCRLIAGLSLIVSFGEYFLWASTGEGYTQTAFGTEAISPLLTNPMVLIYWLLLGVSSSLLAENVREYALAPIPWFSTRHAYRALTFVGVAMLVVLVLVFLQLSLAIMSGGMEAVLSPSMTRIGIPIGIMVNAILLRYVAFNRVAVKTFGAFAEPVAAPGIAVQPVNPSANPPTTTNQVKEKLR